MIVEVVNKNISPLKRVKQIVISVGSIDENAWASMDHAQKRITIGTMLTAYCRNLGETLCENFELRIGDEV